MAHEIIEKKLKAGGLTSHTLLCGDPSKPAAILMHGAGPGASAASNWTRCMPDLAEDYYVIAPDLIGFGQSEIPKKMPQHISGWIGHRVEQTIGILDELNIEKSHMLGNSMGGALSFHLTMEEPDRFDKVAIMGAIGAPMTTTTEMRRLLNFYNDPRINRYREMMHSFVYDPTLVPELEDIVQTRFGLATHPDVEAVQQVLIRTMKEGMNDLIIPPSALARMPHEFAIFHGRQDRIVPLETSLYFLEHLKNAELHVLDRCGHWAQTQRWDAMLPALREHWG
ncbi:MAG: alpha/beta hydrolase [Immundisolibacteraceae bacterium]|nr:alpha/beta hydrolase [Immundisolibacteraceae bacterium]